MSDARPLNFRRLEAEDDSPSGPVARPAWLNVGAPAIRPAPFAAAQDEVEPEPHQPPPPPPRAAQAAPQPVAHEASKRTREPSSQTLQPVREPATYMSDPTAPRSSLPPRKSVAPPQVVIRSLPPPPVEEAKPTAEQEAFAQAALELASLRARILSSCESELLALAVHIAQSIMEREVTIDPTLHQNLARTAVLALGDTQAARLRVSRTAFRAITELYGEAAIDVDGVRVEVSMDASLDALSVVAEGGPSRVDARMDERLTAVLRAMLAEHRRRNAVEEES